MIGFLALLIRFVHVAPTPIALAVAPIFLIALCILPEDEA